MTGARIARTFLLVALGTMLALGTLGCQRAAERVVEEATGVRVDDDDNSVTVQTDEGEATFSGSDASLPDDWPSDVPAYPDAEIESSTSMRMGDSVQMAVTWTTSDDVTTVYEWYRDELPAAGWEVTGDFSMEQDGQRTANISSSKGSSDANVFIGDDSDGVTLISIQVRIE
jgi:hypothetical protein